MSLRPASLALLAVLAAGPCAAQMTACPSSLGQGQKVLVDDIRGVESLVLDTLRGRVDAALAKLQLETRAARSASSASAPDPRVRAVRCFQRLPPDGSAFDDDVARELNAREVVLEVWAQTAALPPSQGPGFRALVGYALVPLRHYMPASPQGVLVIESKTRSVDSIDDLLALLDQSGALAIYTAVGSGVRFLHIDAYDEARTQLCAALGRLERIRKPSPDDVELKEAVRAMAQDVVRRARADPGYRGDMRASDPRSCIPPPV